MRESLDCAFFDGGEGANGYEGADTPCFLWAILQKPMMTYNNSNSPRMICIIMATPKGPKSFPMISSNPKEI